VFFDVHAPADLKNAAGRVKIRDALDVDVRAPDR